LHSRFGPKHSGESTENDIRAILHRIVHIVILVATALIVDRTDGDRSGSAGHQCDKRFVERYRHPLHGYGKNVIEGGIARK